jgi:hypothetical protein
MGLLEVHLDGFELKKIGKTERDIFYRVHICPTIFVPINLNTYSRFRLRFVSDFS